MLILNLCAHLIKDQAPRVCRLAVVCRPHPACGTELGNKPANLSRKVARNGHGTEVLTAARVAATLTQYSLCARHCSEHYKQ